MLNKEVMIFGTFDIFHLGHKNFLQQAKRLGDYLIVVIARDKTVKLVKGEIPWNDENQRRLNVIKSNLADKVVLGRLGNKYEIVRFFKPDLIALGYDQVFFIDKLKTKLIEMQLSEIEIVRLKSFFPEKYKSSKIKALIDR